MQETVMDMFWFWLFFSLLVLHNGEEYLFADRLADVFAGRGSAFRSRACALRW
jgi:hypothetical protein